MSKFLCSAYSSLEAYVPGEQPKDYSKFVKLNTNESPFLPSPQVLEALCSDEAKRLNLYPALDSPRIRSGIAQAYGANSNSVVLTNGSDEALSFAFMAFCGGEHPVAFADITYGFYKVYAQLYGCDYTLIPLRDDLSICPEDYIGINKNIFIANPNAPTGILLSVEDIERIVSSNPDNIVLIDEAYIDFGGESCAPLTKKYDNLIVTGTFSKSRSLAGGRLGYMLCCGKLFEDLNKIRYSTNPYNINRLTLAAGAAAIESVDYYDDCCKKIIENRTYLCGELRSLGFELTESAANFVFASPAHGDAAGLYTFLKENGVLVRYFTQSRISNRLRITIGTREQLDILLDKIRRYKNA